MWEEITKEIALLVERKQAIEKHVMDSRGKQSGEEYCEWVELKDKIASLTFKRDWEFAQDHFAIDRSK